MGCDIHAVFQKQVGSKWVDIPSNEWKQGRHYYLFAWLADVRNGFGFAGIKTGEPIKPISKPRGLPNDFQIEDDKHKTLYGKYTDEDQCWMGDHSYSWLFCDEILSTNKPSTRKTGVISLEQYKNWNKVSTPQEYSGLFLDLISEEDFNRNLRGDILVVVETPKCVRVRIVSKTNKTILEMYGIVE